MQINQNQVSFDGTYSNLTAYHPLSKNIEIFQLFSKSEFCNFMTKVNPNNGNATKSDIIP